MSTFTLKSKDVGGQLTIQQYMQGGDFITVHALSSKLDLDKNVTPAYLGFIMHAVTLAKASLIVYSQKQ